MKFATLQPFASATAEAGVFELNFNCPGCGARTVILVSERPPVAPVWQIKPRMPKAGLDHEPEWHNATIEPSIQDVPHSQRSTCRFRHFSITAGEVEQH